MKGKQIIYSKAELAWCKRNRTWPRKKAYEKFCKIFGRTDIIFDNFKALYTRKGWNTGRTGCIEKGNIPWNKGKEFAPGTGGNHPNARKTQFKKGQEPHNTKYLGHERIDTKDGYVYISIAEPDKHTGFKRRYELKHKYLWEKKNGKLPKGYVLKCLDGNKQNCDPVNWEAIPRGCLPFLNGHRGHEYDKAPKEIKPVILTLAKLKQRKSKITQHTR